MNTTGAHVPPVNRSDFPQTGRFLFSSFRASSDQSACKSRCHSPRGSPQLPAGRQELSLVEGHDAHGCLHDGDELLKLHLPALLSRLITVTVAPPLTECRTRILNLGPRARFRPPGLPNLCRRASGAAAFFVGARPERRLSTDVLLASPSRGG